MIHQPYHCPPPPRLNFMEQAWLRCIEEHLRKPPKPPEPPKPDLQRAALDLVEAGAREGVKIVVTFEISK